MITQARDIWAFLSCKTAGPRSIVDFTLSGDRCAFGYMYSHALILLIAVSYLCRACVCSISGSRRRAKVGFRLLGLAFISAGWRIIRRVAARVKTVSVPLLVVRSGQHSVDDRFCTLSLRLIVEYIYIDKYVYY